MDKTHYIYIVIIRSYKNDKIDLVAFANEEAANSCKNFYDEDSLFCEVRKLEVLNSQLIRRMM